MTVRIVALADTHLFTEGLVLPDGDLLVHAGDLLRGGSLDELQAGVALLADAPHPHKVFVAGNHDRCFEDNPAEALEFLPDDVTYLQDDGVEIAGIRIWGSPWQPEFLGWAFNLPRGEALAEKWALIPDDTDLLVTHGPPHGFGDRAWGKHLGCRELTKARRRVRPALHCFGHIHEDRGTWEEDDGVVANVTTAEGDHPPMVFDFDPATSAVVRVAAMLVALTLSVTAVGDAAAQSTLILDDPPDAGRSDADAPRPDSGTPSSSTAPDDATTDAGSGDAAAKEDGGEGIVIVGLSDVDPASLRAPAWERTAQPAETPIVRSAAWVRLVLKRSHYYVRVLQRPAQRVRGLDRYFRGVVLYQAAAVGALENGDLVAAAALTMGARQIARRGMAAEKVTVFDDFEDTEGEVAYAGQATKADVVPHLKAAYDEWDEKRTNPYRSPHHFRWEHFAD